LPKEVTRIGRRLLGFEQSTKEKALEKRKTHFEVVPVEFAKKVAALEALAPRRHLVFCVLCENPVALEHCKTDEDGNAVHEACYLSKVATKPRTRIRHARPRTYGGLSL
jgi:hypothetical protein